MSDNRREMLYLALERAATIGLALFAIGLAYQGAFCLLRH